MTHLIGKLIILVTALTAATTRADLVATVDRTIISDSDFLTLTVRASNETADNEPDFSVLDRDFEVLSVSPQRNSSFSIINGRTASISYVDYVIRLAPKRLGNLNIPAIRASSFSTRPIPIRVQPLTAAEQRQMNQFVYFETTVDTNEVYVQGQIIYTVKLFYNESIGGDFPQAPELPDTVVETLDNEKRYESIVNGTRYYVLEKRYAIFPQRSGELVIPKERFNGSLGRGGIFARKQPVSAVSNSHRINVKTIPTSFSGKYWLPAKNLTLVDAWADPNRSFEVGEPVNRTITLSVTGLANTSLPEMINFSADNAKVYADPPNTVNEVSEDGLNARQITTIGIVPIEAGELYLPEIAIPWWNTLTDREQIAILPAVTVTVLPSSTKTSNVPTVTIPVTELSQPSVIQTSERSYWKWSTILLGLLFLFSTWQWLTLRRHVAVLESANVIPSETAAFVDPDEQREYQELKTACIRNRARDAHHQLLLWAKARYPNVSHRNQLSHESEQLAKALGELESHLFSNESQTSWRGSAMIEAVDALRDKTPASAGTRMLTESLNPT